jgi:hypothetical protein
MITETPDNIPGDQKPLDLNISDHNPIIYNSNPEFETNIQSSPMEPLRSRVQSSDQSRPRSLFPTNLDSVSDKNLLP